MSKRTAVALAATAFLASTAVASAQCTDWPPDQMKLVISHGVDSSQNQTTRALGDAWEEKLGTKFVYENRPGASGRVGYDYFLQQPQDGTVLLSSNQASASIMYAQQNPDWDWKESVYPVGVFGVDPGALFVRRDSEYKTINDIIEAAKQKPLTLGVSFWASPENLQVHQVMDQTGAQFEVIPVESSGELVTQVLGGHIDVGYNKAAIVNRSGDALKIVAVPMAKNPIPDATENAPTLDEALGTKTLGIASYRGILAHKSWAEANPECLEKLRETFVETTEDPEFIKAMENLGVEPGLIVSMSHDEIYEQVLDRYWEAFDKFGDIYKAN